MTAKKIRKIPTAEKNTTKRLIHLTPTQQLLLTSSLFLLLLLVYFFPIVFENKVPPSTDIIAWKGNAESILEARKLYHGTPLWANNVFSGMPAHLISLRPPFEQPARYVIEGLSFLFKWQVVYYMLGALGVILLLRYWQASLPAAAFAALAFIWWPHLIGLLEAGHNSKLQTIMCMPLSLFLFLRLLDKASLLNFSLFTIVFSLAVRAGHYQIVFYLGLMLAAFALIRLIVLIRQKQRKAALLRIALIVIGLGFGVAMSAFQSLQVNEYSKYSIRGGTGEEGSTGLDMDYATQWSLYPGEMYNFIIPRFWGGHSSQLYVGDAVPQLKGRVIPGYWGHMPFTSTTDYLGVVAVILGLLGIVLAWKRPTVKILTGFMIFSLLLAFGRHFPLLYQVFFNWMPFFDKFRIPTMIVVMVMFSNALLAGFGLQALLEKVKENNLKKVVYQILPVFGIVLLLGVIPLLLRNSLAFLRPDESKSYSPEIISLLKAVRFDLLKSDALRMLALTAAAFGLVFSYLKYNLPRALFVGAMIALLLLDLLPVNKRYMQQLIPKQQMEDYFSSSRADQFMQADKEPHRVFPLGELSSEAHWSYFHQSIEGYHPAKLRIYQDIREGCLYEGKDSGFNNAQTPINWNIINMLNAKYLIAQQEIQHPNLVPVFRDQEQQLLVYKNNRALPRAFCVGRTEVIPDRQMRLQRLNQFSFKPDSVAILEKELPDVIDTPQQWSTQITRFEPNLIDLKVNSDKPTLLVLSEIFYPAGWSAVVNGTDAEIYKVNHILRGVSIPAGESTIRFKLAPRSFQISLTLMSVSMAVIYGLLIVALVLDRRQSSRRSIKTA